MLTHRCKFHDETHPYRRCPTCQCEYCPDYWTQCPRCADRAGIYYTRILTTP